MILTGRLVFCERYAASGAPYGSNLPAEAAADLLRRQDDLRLWNAERVGRAVTDFHGPLRAAPDVDATVLIPVHRRVLGLDVPLMHRRGVEGPLDDEVGLGEPLFHIALHVVDVLLDVRRSVAVFAVVLGAVLLVEDRSVVRKTLRGGHRGGQHLVLHLDEGQRLLCVVDGVRRDPGYGMALVEHLLARHQRLAQVLVLPVLREVRGGRYRSHARMGLGLARVDRLDDRVRVRTPKYLPAQQPRRVLVCPVLGDARHLVRAVVADGTLSDGLELHLRQNYVRLISCGHGYTSHRGKLTTPN